MSVDDFAESLAAPTPTPGGGAAAARVGRYACSLLRMASGITLKKLEHGSEEHGSKALKALLEQAASLSSRLEGLETEDMAAFEAYLTACRMPRSTPAEKESRRAAREKAILRATQAPLGMLDAARGVLIVATGLLDLTSTTPLKAESDLFAAVELASACFRVAELNVRANWPYLAAERAEGVHSRWETLRVEFQTLYERLRRQAPVPPGSL